MVEVNITYETLFDLLRREKSRAELQTLEKNFYEQVFEYIRTKNDALNTSNATTSYSEKEKLKIQIKNAKKIIKELYELREKKIVLLSINKVKTGSKLINTEVMLESEKNLFDDSCKVLQKYKDSTLNFDIKNKPRATTQTNQKEEEKEKQQESKEIEVEFTVNLPKFVGQDGTIHGPYNLGETKKLPTQIAKLLIEKNKAKKI